MHIDILEPAKDLNVALDQLEHELGAIYKEGWDATLLEFFGKPYHLQVQAFATLWFQQQMKIFIVYNDKNEPIGYLLGMSYRPMAFASSVFQIDNWYIRNGTPEMEAELFKHVIQAVRYIGNEEIWISHPTKTEPDLGTGWVKKKTVTQRMYEKAD